MPGLASELQRFSGVLGAISPDWRLMALTRREQEQGVTLILSDLASGEEIHTLKAPGDIYGVSFWPQGQWVAAKMYNVFQDLFSFWSVDNGRLNRTLYDWVGFCSSQTAGSSPHCWRPALDRRMGSWIYSTRQPSNGLKLWPKAPIASGTRTRFSHRMGRSWLRLSVTMRSYGIRRPGMIWPRFRSPALPGSHFRSTDAFSPPTSNRVRCSYGAWLKGSRYRASQKLRPCILSSLHASSRMVKLAISEIVPSHNNRIASPRNCNSSPDCTIPGVN